MLIFFDILLHDKFKIKIQKSKQILPDAKGISFFSEFEIKKKKERWLLQNSNNYIIFIIAFNIFGMIANTQKKNIDI